MNKGLNYPVLTLRAWKIDEQEKYMRVRPATKWQEDDNYDGNVRCLSWH